VEDFLTYILFLPVVGAILIWLMPSKQDNLVRIIALITMSAGTVLGIVLWFACNPENLEHQNYYFETFSLLNAMAGKTATPWFTLAGVDVFYHVGIDGISLLLIELTLLLGPIVILSSWTAVTEKVKEYHIFMLLLQTGMLGAFLALDLFLFYVFWELMLIPMYFLIGVWGGERRIYASIKFFLFTMAGSVLMLLAIIYLVYVARYDTFDIEALIQLINQTPLTSSAQIWLFAAFAIAFAIKVPMFPFHTWLPDAHVEAPTAGSVILAGVLLKMGTYGFIRFAMPLFPYAVYEAVPVISVLAIIGIIYGALVAMMQEDVKKLVAYSSVSHLGFVMLGLFALNTTSVQGSLIQMINHGLSTGALFLLVGIIYERRHTRMISDFGGLAKSVPIFAVFFMIALLSSVGLPGLNGFVGEFLILIGTYASANPYSKIYAILAASGVILAACYLLWMFQRVMFGPLTKDENRKLKDLNLRELFYLIVLMIFIVWIGVYPNTFLVKSEKSIERFIKIVEQGRELTLKFEGVSTGVSDHE
jgi:NADH-quinone oxidoreductase subunit M